MKQRILAMLLLLVFVVGSVPGALAHGDQSKHDRDLKHALFGSPEKALTGEEKTIFKAISNAAALTIDQFSQNEQLRQKESTYNKLQGELKELGLPALPNSFDNLDLNINVAPDGKNITANSHRKYTHLGWNYKDYPNEEFWKTRKQVLLHTVNWTLFNDKAFFSKIPGIANALYPPSEQCEAFCAMVYYIHILGDHIEGDKPEKLTDLEPLIQYTNLSTPGIIAELKEQLSVVFVSQEDSWTYAALMDKLTGLTIRAERNCATWGAIDTKEKCTLNQDYANELLGILSDYLPNLLKYEPFFSSHFKQALKN